MIANNRLQIEVAAVVFNRFRALSSAVEGAWGASAESVVEVIRLEQAASP